VSIVQAIVLGVVQGLSEFLPISSSGHLEIVPWLFGWDLFQGQDEDLRKTFEVALHMGTFVGAAWYFRRDLARLLLGVTARLRPVASRAGPGDPTAALPADAEWADPGRMAWLLVLSAVPAGITGVALEGAIVDLSDHHGLIGGMLVVFGLVLLWADRLPGERPSGELTVRDALTMGVAQALALQPGVSRSGVTISAARYLGFRRDAAARVAFLMSLPVIGGAGVYKALDVAAEGGIPSGFVGPFLWGTVASAATGWLAVWGTLRFVRTRSFRPFVVYRVALGLVVMGLAATGVR
jgi:undecaprenyl-diphosphatase